MKSFRTFALLLPLLSLAALPLGACASAEEETDASDGNLTGQQLSSQDFKGVPDIAFGSTASLAYKKSSVKYVKAAHFKMAAGDIPQISVRSTNRAARPVVYLVRKLARFFVAGNGDVIGYANGGLFDPNVEGNYLYDVVAVSKPGADPSAASIAGTVAFPPNTREARPDDVARNVFIENTGDYYVAVRDANGADNTFTVSLTNSRPATPPPPPIPGFDVTPCAGTPVAMSALPLMIPQGQSMSMMFMDKVMYFAERQCSLAGCTDWRADSGGGTRVFVAIRDNGEMRLQLAVLNSPTGTFYDAAISSNPGRVSVPLRLGAGSGERATSTEVGVDFAATSTCISAVSDVAKSKTVGGSWTERKLATKFSWSPEARYDVPAQPTFADSCDATPATDAQLLSKFTPGDGRRYLTATHNQAYRSCSPTGCTKWGYALLSSQNGPTSIRIMPNNTLALEHSGTNLGGLSSFDAIFPITNGTFTGNDPVFKVPVNGVAGTSCVTYNSVRKSGGGTEEYSRFIGRY